MRIADSHTHTHNIDETAQKLLSLEAKVIEQNSVLLLSRNLISSEIHIRYLLQLCQEPLVFKSRTQPLLGTP